jgi:protein SCO1/2
MRTDARHLAILLALALSAAPCPSPARAQVIMDQPPDQARDLDVVEHLGDSVPLDLELVDETGREVRLGDYFREGRPVILAMGYYDCPLLCTLLFEGLAKSVAPLDYAAGEDFQVVVVSFDPSNTQEDALERKQSALSRYGREVTPAVQRGWAFHTTTAENAQRLADAVGYRYRYLDEIDEYAHGAVVMILTPDGVLSRYLFGLEYPERDLRLALLEASDGQIASGVGDYFLHLCYRWDPNASSYTLAAFRVMQVGASVGAVLLAGLIGLLLIGERLRARRRARREQDAAPDDLRAVAMGRT